MTTIVFASSKGGVGKSTSCLTLAQELAHRGKTVSILDADPNAGLVEWSEEAQHDRITVHGNITDNSIIELIIDESERVPFVLVDLEGTKNLKMSSAIARADLVVVPMKGSHLDARRASDTIKIIRVQERHMDRKIPFGVLFTQAPAAMVTKDERAAREELERAGIPVFVTRMVDRSAYRAIFSYASTLRDLPQNEVRSVPTAIENAEAFTDEVIERLRAERSVAA